MISTTIFPGRYVQGVNVMDIAGEEIARFGKKGFFISSPTAFRKILPKYETNIKKHIEYAVEQFNKECTDEEIDRLALSAKQANSDVIVGIGGGKAIDTAKATAFKLNLPVVIIPTIASTDAPCSALSVVYTSTGEFKRYLVLPQNPVLILVDSEIIINAPSRFLISGMGDALATWFEAESCKKKFAGNMTGNVGSMTAYALAELCYKTLLEYGLQAKLACEANVVIPAVEHIIEANILLSGVGFESGGLASSHAIHNGLTALEATHSYQHGEKVAVGTLASLFITDKPKDKIDEVFAFCREVGLPTTLAEIGLVDVADNDLMKVAELACQSGETIHNEAMPITPKIVFAALKAVDAYGKNLIK